MKIPRSTSLTELQETVRDIYAAIDGITSNLHGKRAQNAGEAISAFDYVRKFDLDAAIADLKTSLTGPTTSSSSALSQNTVTASTPLTLNNIIIGAGLSKVAPLGALGTTVTVLHGNAAGAPTFGAVNLTSDVTGVLPIANGGTAGNTAATARTALGFASSVYTPTLTSVANVAAKTAFQCQYMQVGSVVVVSGKVDVDPTLAASTYTEVGISLPIASSLGAAEDLGGTASSLSSVASGNQGALIGGDAANDRAALSFDATELTNQSFFFIFMYRII